MKISAYVWGTRAWKHRREGILCSQTVERIQEIVDGEIPPSRAKIVLERHVTACKSCDAQAEVFRELKIAISRVSSEADPECVRTLEDLARKLCEGTADPQPE
jgi:anti-sigma factor RsiW